MQSDRTFVASAEAAYIADLSDRQLHRLVDERLVPPGMLTHGGGARRFARLSAAFARFYFDTECLLAAGARRQILVELAARVERAPAPAAVLSLSADFREVDWRVILAPVEVDLRGFVEHAADRARQVDAAGTLVSTDPDRMGGLPCFSGTRVPIENVLTSLDEGLEFDLVREAYPFLTERHVAAARVHVRVHPSRGRPRGFADAEPPLRLRSSRIVRPARA